MKSRTSTVCFVVVILAFGVLAGCNGGNKFHGNTFAWSGLGSDDHWDTPKNWIPSTTPDSYPNGPDDHAMLRGTSGSFSTRVGLTNWPAMLEVIANMRLLNNSAADSDENGDMDKVTFYNVSSLLSTYQTLIVKGPIIVDATNAALGDVRVAIGGKAKILTQD